MGLPLGYAAWMAALTAAYFALPGLSVTFLCLLAVSAAGAIVIQVARCRPAHPLPWLLLSAAALCLGASRLALFADGNLVRIPSWNAYTILSLLKDALLAVALGLFARARSPGRDRQSLVDAVTVTVALATLLWLFRILPILLNPALSGAREFTSTLYPLGDIAVLLALTRLLASGTVWDWPLRLITAGTACGLLSGVAFGLLNVYLPTPAASLVSFTRLSDLSWMFGFALCGAAAVHPAMREMTRHAMRPYETSRARLVTLTLASIVAPLLLILNGRSDARATAIAVTAAVLCLLAQARLWLLNVSQLRILSRERALTARGPAFASTASVEEIAAELGTTADTVPWPRSLRAVIFAAYTGGELRVLMTRSAGRRSRLTETAPRWLPSVLPLLAGRGEDDRPMPLYVPAEELAARSGTGDVRPAGDGVMLCPIFLSTDPAGGPPAGVLALVGSQRDLETGWPSARIMVSEVCLAMERILLTQQRVRREGEELFKELVQDASDAILIIGDDDTVRYASPSAGAIFGGAAPAGRAAAPRLPRRADRTAEPDPVRGPRRACAGTGPSDRDGHRGLVHRPG
jgi:PAS domain-containing protein